MRILQLTAAAALAALVALPFTGGAEAAQSAAPAKVAYAPIPAGAYAIDPAHSVIGFSIRHYELSWVQGRFKDFSGTINYDTDLSKASVEFTAKVESVDTGIGPRDNHLRTADFFEVEKHPTISFKSTRVEKKGASDFVAHGDLTIKGVTKQIALPFTVAGAIVDGRGNTKIGVDAKTTVNRLDFGVGASAPMPSGGAAIATDVTIEISLEAAKAAPKPAGA